MLKLDNILVYHWHAWKGFLISHLVADYCQIEAQYADDFKDLEAHLTPNIRAVLFQVNLSCASHFPARRQQLIDTLQKRNILVLNTEIEDITKRNLYHLLAKAGLKSTQANQTGAAEQLLFIKTNLNCGGVAEQRLPTDLQKKLLPENPPILGKGDDYCIQKRSDISTELWKDTNIVIENYIYNPENSFYRVYGFGDSIIVVKAHSNGLIKKISGDDRDCNILLRKQQLISQRVELPTALQATIKTFITHYPLTYFCLDIIHDTHDYYIIDLNLTPYSGTDEQNIGVLEFLCDGAQYHLNQVQHQEFAHS
jgi:hypothetical protein